MIEPIARIRIELQEIEPKIWRRVDVPLSATLFALHDIIQVAMGWKDAHLFEFVVGDKVYGEPHPDDVMYDRKVYQAKSIRLQTLADRGIGRFVYAYDFGDNWQHDVIIGGLTEVNSIDTEVHLHLFSVMPATPAEALSRSGTSDVALLGKVEAIDSAAGSAEVRADWFIDDSPATPELKPTTPPFRPRLTPGKQQIRAQILRSLDARFDYLFDSGRGNWSPRLGDQALHDEETDKAWYPVTGLHEAETDEVAGLQFLSDLRELSPESGSFILFSRRRRRLGERVP